MGDSQSESIDYYKRLCKALLTKGERTSLQKVLAAFVQNKVVTTPYLLVCFKQNIVKYLVTSHPVPLYFCVVC